MSKCFIPLFAALLVLLCAGCGDQSGPGSGSESSVPPPEPSSSEALTPEEAETLIAAIPALEVESNANWNKRYQENLQRLKSGDLREVARLIKGLMTRDTRRGLSTGERKMLQTAKRILISEIVLSEQADYETVEARIDMAMTQEAAC